MTSRTAARWSPRLLGRRVRFSLMASRSGLGEHPRVLELSEYGREADGPDEYQWYGRRDIEMYVRGWSYSLFDDTAREIGRQYQARRGEPLPRGVFVDKIGWSASSTASPFLSAMTAQEAAAILRVSGAVVAYTSEDPESLDLWAQANIWPYMKRGLTPFDAVLALEAGVTLMEVAGPPDEERRAAWLTLAAFRIER